MGIENFGEKVETANFEKEFSELTKMEQKMMKEIEGLFRGNAELNADLLADEDLNLSVQKKRYCSGELRECRNETKGILKSLRAETGHEIPESMRGLKAADSYYREIKKPA